MTLRASLRRWLRGPRPDADVCIGFDGVLHDPSTAPPLAPYPGGCPVEGAVALLRELVAANARVGVLLTDEAYTPAVRGWLARHLTARELDRVVFAAVPLARAYLLDRAVTFHGVPPTAERLLRTTAWWASRVRFAAPSGSPRPAPESPLSRGRRGD